MNKYQEALERICNNLLCGGECAVGGKPCSLLEPIQELVDKATPQTVIPKWREGYDPELYSPYALHCPRCDRKLRLDQFYKWCPDCNQKLNRYISRWELENEN